MQKLIICAVILITMSGCQISNPQPTYAEQMAVATSSPMDKRIIDIEGYGICINIAEYEMNATPANILVLFNTEKARDGLIQELPDLDWEVSTCRDILVYTPRDTKALARLDYLELSRQKIVAELGKSQGVCIQAESYWENEFSATERARQKDWLTAFNLYSGQGYAADEAAAKADQFNGKLPMVNSATRP